MQIKDLPIHEEVNNNMIESEAEVVDSPRINIMEILKTRTGEGEIEQYIDHPMNFMKSVGVAHILRGFAGFVGNDLKLAIIDIVQGVLQLSKIKKKEVDPYAYEK